MKPLSNHTTVTRYRLTPLIFLIWVSVLLGACNGPGTATLEPSATLQPASNTWTPTVAATKTTTNTPTPSSTPADIEASPTPDLITELVSISAAGLVTENQGWALVANQLLWTSDGGVSWQDITPPSKEEFSIVRITFLDADEGWVAVSPQVECCPEAITIQVFHTTDGGQTWQENSFEADLLYGTFGMITDLEFIDSQHGWLVVDQTASMNSSAADLYYSADGGLSWRVSKLPFNGPVHFITTDVGWMIGNCCTGAPKQLFRTTDGGFTWQQQAIAPYPVEDEFDYNDYTLPVFFTERVGLLAITLQEEPYNPSEVAIYLNEDAGETWQLEATFTPAEMTVPDFSSAVQVQFLQPEYWIAAVGKSVYVTRDAGQTWERFEQSELPGFYTQLMFTTQQVGWSLVFKDNCGSDCLMLYQTLDGGATWDALGKGE
jgi:photosystem II stability/assembly factor-like uncharacterized protein